LNSGRDKSKHHHQNYKSQQGVDNKGQQRADDDDNNEDRDENDDDDDDGNDDNADYPLLEFIGHTRAVYGVSQFNYNAHLNSYSRSNDDQDRSGSSSSSHQQQHINTTDSNHNNNHIKRNQYDNDHDNDDDNDVDSSCVTDDRLVLSCSADETIRLWDTAVSQCVGRYNCVCPSWDVSFNPLGYYFASANQDKTATMYATDRITPIRMFVGHFSDVNCVSWHPNGMLLGTGKL
jgi:hypothetical protein